ncbi:hypothetical protein [Thermoflexus sp.]|uniref:hypothetical protein n=1 Tax=Thermoflexus sp. TaxID=1969742 RepID=UPI001757B29F|nr:hypothetical protein [Thermoflexus sp.]
MENGHRLRVHPEAVRSYAQALRQWAERWLELERQAQMVGRQLSETVRAVPGEQFGGSWAAQTPRRAQIAERSLGLAQALETGIARLDQAFQEAAHGLWSLSGAPSGPLPDIPLAVDANGRPIASQFEMRVDAEILRRAGVSEDQIARLQEPDGRIRWYAACGPVALSVALRALGQPVTAQEAVDRMLAERMADKGFRERIQNDVASRLQKGRRGLGFYTGEEDLKAIARSYGTEMERARLPDGQRDPEALWRGLRERLERGEQLMMLVRIQERRGAHPGDGRLVSYTTPEDPNTVPHWVTLGELEEGADGRYVTLYNPYQNTRERYRWEEFVASIDGQARGGSWWALSVRNPETGGIP